MSKTAIWLARPVSEAVPGGIAVTSPYCHEITGAARAAGGRWNERRKAWIWPELTSRVREAYRRVYGLAPDEEPLEIFDLELLAASAVESPYRSYHVCGRQIVWVGSEDSEPSLGYGVTLVDGSIDASRTSIRFSAGCRLMVEDLPGGCRGMKLPAGWTGAVRSLRPLIPSRRYEPTRVVDW